MRRIAEFKRDNASLLNGLVPEHEKEAFLEHKVVNVMKGRDQKGRRLLIVNVGGKDIAGRPSDCDCFDVLILYL